MAHGLLNGYEGGSNETVKTLILAVGTCYVLLLSVSGCATCSQASSEQPDKVSWWKLISGFIARSAEETVYGAASANSENQSH